MKTRMRVLAGLLCAVVLVVLAADVFAGARGGRGGDVSVKGYFRKDGTYVQPHTRSAPDSSPYNNYSLPGNYNPNTGTVTPGDPNKYLERYYEKKGGYSWPKTGTDD